MPDWIDSLSFPESNSNQINLSTTQKQLHSDWYLALRTNLGFGLVPSKYSVVTLLVVTVMAMGILAWFFDAKKGIQYFAAFTHRISCVFEITTPPLRQGVNSDIDHQQTSAPNHIAVIMDGNRRYGRAKYNSAKMGHSDGGKKLVEVINWCEKMGIKVLTAYAFSTENWKRGEDEVNYLMQLFMDHIKQIHKESLDRNMKIQVFASDPHLIPKNVKDALDTMERETSDHNGFQLNLCISYGSRSEIVGACRQLAERAVAGEIKPCEISEDMFSGHLLSKGVPDPDLLIRTSGEQRVSNFLLWQLAYTEMIFIPKTWPAITQDDLIEALSSFSKRHRRFGK